MANRKRISLYNLSLPAVPDSPKDENYVEFSRLYNAVKNLTSVVDMGQAVATATAVEAIGFGRFVSFFDDGKGGLKAKLADATSPTISPAHAFCLTADMEAGDTTEFVLAGLHPGFSGLIPGARYWLASGGGISLEASYWVQSLGFAISSTSMWVHCNQDFY